MKDFKKKAFAGMVGLILILFVFWIIGSISSYIFPELMSIKPKQGHYNIKLIFKGLVIACMCFVALGFMYIIGSAFYENNKNDN